MASMPSKPKLVFANSSVSSGSLRSLTPLTVTSTEALGALDLGGPGDGLGLVDVHAQQTLVELLGQVAGTHGDYAALASERLGAVLTFLMSTVT